METFWLTGSITFVILIFILLFFYEPENSDLRHEVDSLQFYCLLIAMVACLIVGIVNHGKNSARLVNEERVLKEAGDGLKFQGVTDVVITDRYCVETNTGEVKVFKGTCSELETKKSK